jgi:cell division protein FtsI (penicillin-binding protein 3)
MSRLDLPLYEHPAEDRAAVRARAAGRAKGIGGLLALLLVVIGARGVQLTVDPHEQTVAAGGAQRWGQVTLRGRRGDIVDRHGRQLATSADAPTIAADPSILTEAEIPELAASLARILELPASEVEEKLRKPLKYVRLKTRVHPAVARDVQRIGHRGVWAHRDPRRFYPEEGLAAQVVGFVDGGGRGTSGLEASMEEHLRGGAILLQHRRDRRGYDVDPVQTDQAPSEGFTVHTTIDRAIQRVAERALAGAMERHAAAAAYATVVDVRTGDVLAIASAPFYNPNKLGDTSEGQKNHALQDLIEPGSVFKPFTMAAAMEEGKVSENSRINCEGGSYYIGRTRIRDDHPHGTVTATEVIKYSSNIGSAKLALDVGASRFIQYMRDFGFGERTGIPLPGERRGRVRSAQSIKAIELATTSYGQGVTTTQIQLAMATAALANGGLLMAPRLVTRVEDADGVPVWQEEPRVVRRVVSEETANTVARMMVSVTEPGGTGTRARVPGYLVGGKTGTAEKVKDGRYSQARIGSFVGFLPADNPVLAIVVSVDEPTQGSRYGGIVAAPVFAEIGKFAMRHLGVAPNQPIEEPKLPGVAAAPAPPPSLLEGPDGLAALRLAWAGDGWTVPDLRGRSMREVLGSFEGSGVGVRLEGSGLAVAQRPEPGTRAPLGSQVQVTFQ